MRKHLFLGLIGLLVVILAACGSSATAVPAAKQAPAAPAAAAQPAAPAAAAQPAAPAAVAAPAAKAAPAAAAQPAVPAAPAAVAAPGVSPALVAYAAKVAGGPGSIYVGDLNQMVGLAPGTGGLGDLDTNQVPLAYLQKNIHMFETPYYRSLLEKAKLTNPTPLTTSGKNIDIQYACINRALQPCELSIVYLLPNVLKRTNGQINLKISSYPELGLSGPDMMELISNGSISFAQVQPAYVGGTLPFIDILYQWGAWKDLKSEHLANTGVLPDLDAAVAAKSGDAKVVYHIWYAGNSQYLFSKNPLTKPEDFKGLKARSHGTTMSDYIIGLGGEAVIIPFAETYTAIERGILNGGASGADAGWGQRWYEVTKYLVGPALSTPMGFETMNKKVWDSLPADFQQILIEEGAKMELENLRLGAVWNETGVAKNVRKGMVEQAFSPEMEKFVYNTVWAGRVFPNWLKRVGPKEIAAFNAHYGPYLGIQINADKSLTNVPITGAQKAPAAAPAAAAKPAAPAAVAAPAAPTGLAAYAAQYAGKPGAIYLGDIKQLVGPAPTKDQGDFDGNVPLESLQRHLYVYDSDYYKGLLAKAKLTNPTPLVSTGQNITIQHACINRALLPCKMSDSYFFPNVLARTKGQVKLVTSSFPELGLAGPDTLKLVTDGTLSMADIYGGYVGGDLPAIEIQVLWGMFPDKQTEFKATAAITPDLEKLVTAATGGGQLVNHNWYSGNDQVFITKKPLKTAADFKGLRTRSHSTALSDWIQGMGATAQVVAFAETYAALERGILDAAVSGADAAYGQRWYEVADYINWGLESFPSTNNVINGKVWAKIPPDLQQIIIEEGAKSELEALRVAAIQNEMGVLKNTKAGLELVPFSPELKEVSTNSAFFKNVLPSWIKRVGGGNAKIITEVFNPKVGPLVGLRIEADGTVTRIPKVN